jgi:hypothetical protein
VVHENLGQDAFRRAFGRLNERRYGLTCRGTDPAQRGCAHPHVPICTLENIDQGRDGRSANSDERIFCVEAESDRAHRRAMSTALFEELHTGRPVQRVFRAFPDVAYE